MTLMEEVKIDYVGTYKRSIQTWGEAEIQGKVKKIPGKKITG